MKRNYILASKFVFIGALVLLNAAAAFSQRSFTGIDSDETFARELRPFDFSDRHYHENGVEPGLIADRRNGDDKYSVIDFINDPKFRGVRIRAVFPAYDAQGGIVYWNLYGELFKDGFRADAAGDQAIELAHRYPIYIFPSETTVNSLRQGHLIDLQDGYFEKNPLGLGVQVLVNFTERSKTVTGKKELRALAERNGLSLDGTPIIKTSREIEDLTRMDLITQRVKGLDDPTQPPFAIARVIENPARGAIADGFLITVLNSEGKPLLAEYPFTQNFNCLQTNGNWCGK